MSPKDRELCENEIVEAVKTVATEYFKPTTTRLLQLCKNESAGVRIYAAVLLADLSIEHMPVIPAAILAHIAFRFRMLALRDADRRVRNCGHHQLNRLLEACETFSAACKAAKEDADAAPFSRN